jgi:dihydrofolate reductase
VSALPLIIVVAVAENGVIGRNNELPWRLPGDAKHFKRLTIGKPVVMGLSTLLSMGKALPGRANIVLTRDPNFSFPDVQVARDLESGLALAAREAERLGAKEIAVIGGAGVFAEALPRVARIELTEVHARPDGDTRFPVFDRTRWRETRRDGPHQEPGATHPYSFVTLERRQ